MIIFKVVVYKGLWTQNHSCNDVKRTCQNIPGQHLTEYNYQMHHTTKIIRSVFQCFGVLLLAESGNGSRIFLKKSEVLEVMDSFKNLVFSALKQYVEGLCYKGRWKIVSENTVLTKDIDGKPLNTLNQLIHNTIQIHYFSFCVESGGDGC